MKEGKVKLKWTVEFEVDEIWVEDGFDLDDDRALAMLANDLRFAFVEEIGAKVVKSPSPDQIAKLQGRTWHGHSLAAERAAKEAE
jgi:hypothetical protein